MVQSVRFRAPGEQVVGAITAALARRGYSLMRSFDLQTVRARHSEGCACPHHGTAECTCQYVVLLAYPPVRAGRLAAPSGITAHTNGDTTLVTVHSDQARDGEDRLVVMAAVLEAAGELAESCAEELDPGPSALTEL
jgi:hypothetical protein